MTYGPLAFVAVDSLAPIHAGINPPCATAGRAPRLRLPTIILRRPQRRGLRRNIPTKPRHQHGAAGNETAGDGIHQPGPNDQEDERGRKGKTGNRRKVAVAVRDVPGRIQEAASGRPLSSQHKSSMRIYDGISTQRSRMNPGCMAAGVGVVCHPGVAFDMLLQNEDMPASCCNHSRRRRCSRKPQPIGREIELRHDSAEHANRSPATAKGMRATGRATADGLTARFRDFTWIDDIALRTPLHAVRSLTVRVEGNLTCLRIGKVAGHCDIAPGRLTHDARWTRFGSRGREDDECRRNQDLFDHTGSGFRTRPKITGQ